MKTVKRIISLACTAAMLAAYPPPVMAAGAAATDYNGFEVHLGDGDSLSDGVITWLAPGSTTSDNTVVSNNRYIAFTPEADGVITLTFNGSALGNPARNTPRLYIVPGEDESCMSKNNSDSSGKAVSASGANRDTEVKEIVNEGMTYYIWPYCYGNWDCTFTIKNLEYTAQELTPVSTIKAVYKSAGETVTERLVDIGSGHYAGDSYTYISPAYITGDDGDLYAVGIDSHKNLDCYTISEDSSTRGINNTLKKALTLADGIEVEYSVTKADADFFSEWEDITGGAASSFSNGRYFASKGTMGAINGTVEFYTVPEDGFYRVTVVGGGDNRGTEIFKSHADADAATAYGGGTAVTGIIRDSSYNNSVYALYASGTAFLQKGNALTMKNYRDAGDPVDYVTVSKIELPVSGKTIMSPGERVKYSIPAIHDAKGNNLTAEYASVSYSSDNEDVLKVNATTGDAAAVGKGKATLTAAVTMGAYTQTQELSVTVDNYSIIAEADGDSTVVDVTDIVKSDNITGYTVTTADEDGNELLSYEINGFEKDTVKSMAAKTDLVAIYASYDEDSRLIGIETRDIKAGEEVSGKDGARLLTWNSLDSMVPAELEEITVSADTVTVDTAGATAVEIAPVYTYEYADPDTNEDMLLPDAFADGDYDFAVTKAPDNMYRCIYDLYINDAMIGNNVNEKAIGRESMENYLTYKADDITVEGGTITLQKREFYSFSGTLRAEEKDRGISKIVVTKKPTITERKTKAYILGDSLVAIYYGDPVGGYTQDGLVGTARTGWGQVIDDFFDDSIETLDLANSGQWATGLQDTAFSCVMQSANAGDYMILESGWNDVSYSTRFEMHKAVVEMAEDAIEKGITPILVSPNSSAMTYSKGKNTQYASVMRSAAAEVQSKYAAAKFVDLAELSYNFLTAAYGSDTDAMNKSINLGYAGSSTLTGERGDSLHLSYLGAMKYAELVAQSMADQGIPFINKDFSWSITDKSGNEITVQVR